MPKFAYVSIFMTYQSWKVFMVNKKKDNVHVKQAVLLTMKS